MFRFNKVSCLITVYLLSLISFHTRYVGYINSGDLKPFYILPLTLIQDGGGPKIMLLPRYYHFTHFEFRDFCVCFLLPEFYCRSLNPVEAIEGRRITDHFLGD